MLTFSPRESTLNPRLLALAPLLSLSACGLQSATRAELEDVRRELDRVRERSLELEERLERVELERSVELASRQRQSSAPPGRVEPELRPVARAPVQLRASELAEAEAREARTEAAEEEAPPGELVVIRLKPNKGPAPKLPNRAALKEPDAKMLAELAQPAPTAKPPRQAESAADASEYDAALVDLRDGQAARGIRRLQTFARANPEHPLADNALYFSGVGLMGQGEYRKAVESFEAVIDGHPASDAVAQSLLRLAECRVRLSQHDEAKLAYRRVLTSYPGTEAAAQAEQRLASFAGTN